MSIKVREIVEKLNKLAPEHLAEDWDNIGLQVGSMESDITKILVALDASQAVIDEAIQKAANMIIVHHPMIFNPLKKITKDDADGRKIYKLIKNDISLYVMHTNFDATLGGTNDILSKIIGLTNIKVLRPSEEGMGIGRVGDITKTTIGNLGHKLKKDLSLTHAKIVGSPQKEINKVAICTGSGMAYLKYAIGIADVFITGDVKFHEAQKALENKIGIIDIGHYGSENIAMPSNKKQCRNNGISNQ